MHKITATFPTNIPIQSVKNLIEGNLKQNSKHPCTVDFLEFDGKENVFTIAADSAHAFFLAGITTANIIDTYNALA